MGVSEGFVGFGSLFKIGDGASPETFTTVAEVKSIKPGKMTAGTADVTHMESPNEHREKIPTGLKDTSPFVISGNYLPKNATQGMTGRGLAKLFQDQTVFNFKIVLSDSVSSEWTNSGFITGLEIGDLVLDSTLAVPFTCEITVGGQTTLPA
jgi:hypothetical protein